MTVIGLFGYWAAAGALCNESASRLPAIRRHMNAMVFLPPTRRRDDGWRAPFVQVRLVHGGKRLLPWCVRRGLGGPRIAARDHDNVTKIGRASCREGVQTEGDGA